MFKANRLIFKNVQQTDLDINSSHQDILEGARIFNQNQDAEQSIKMEINNKIDPLRKELEALSQLGFDPNQRWIDQESALKYKLELEKDTDPKTKIQILEKLDARRHRFKEWQKSLPLGNNLILDDGSRIATVFTLDPSRGLDSAAHATKRFISLSDQEQEAWLKQQLAKINHNKALFNRLVGMVSREFKSEELKLFQTQTRQEREEYLKLYEQHTHLIDRAKYDPEIKDRLKVIFAEKGIHGKKLEIARLREAISVNNLDKSFEDTPAKYRSISAEKFYSLENRDKRAEIEKIKEKLRKEYIDLYKHADFYSSRDIKLFNQFAYSEFDIQDMLNSINIYFPESEILARQVQKDTEEKGYSPELLESQNWDNLDFREKRKLLDSGDLEINEHNKWNEKYEAKLKIYMPDGEHGKFGLINKKSAKSYLEWYKKQSIKDKKKFLQEDDIDKTIKKRTENNQAFEALKTKHPQYYKEYLKKYMQADSEGRAKIIDEIKEKEKSLTTNFKDKLKLMLKAKTLAPSSEKQYMQWFADLNISDKEKYLAASELDDENREKVLQSFQEDIVPNLPKNKKKEIEKKFYNSNLDKRIKLLTKYLEEYGEGKNIQDVLPPEAPKSAENITLDFLLEKAKEFSAEGKTSTAIDLYQSWLDKTKDFPDLATNEQINQVKAEIKRLKEENIELKSNNEVPPQLLFFIENECQDLINNDPALQTEVTNLTVIREIAETMKRTELRYGQKPSVNDQMNDSIQDNNIIEFNEYLQTNNQQQQSIVQENGQYSVQDAQIFNMEDFKNDQNYRENWTENMAGEMFNKPDEDRVNRSIGAKIDGREVSADEFSRREVQPIEQEVDSKLSEILLKKYADKGYNVEAFKPIIENTIANLRHEVTILPKENKKLAA